MERGHVVLRHGMEKRLRVYDIGHGTWDIKRFLKADSNLSWVCIGDFNELLQREEQMGPNDREMWQINQFREVVNVCQLCDIGYIRLDRTFEWKLSNNEYCRVWLDRFLASVDWCTNYPFVIVHPFMM